MGRYSPSTPVAPSWTQGLEQGTGTILQSLLANRQYNLQKQAQQFSQGMQTETQGRENAQAGYDPHAMYTPADAQAGLATTDPANLAQISNAGVADASHMSYDPTKSGAYAVWQPRLQNSIQRANIMAGARTGAADIRGKYGLAAIAARYGSMQDDGTGNMVYTPGVQTQSTEAAQQPKLDMEAGWHDQLGRQFQQRQADTNSYHAQQIGLGQQRVGIQAQRAVANSPQQKQLSAVQRQTALTNAAIGQDQRQLGDPMVMGDSTQVRQLNQHMAGLQARRDSLTNVGDSISHVMQAPPANNPAAVGNHIDKNPPSTSQAPPQGLGQPLVSNGRTNQHVRTAAPQITASPTQPIGQGAPNTGAYNAAAQNYKQAAAGIDASGADAPTKAKAHAALQARYNADVAKIAAPR